MPLNFNTGTPLTPTLYLTKSLEKDCSIVLQLQYEKVSVQLICFKVALHQHC